MQNRYIPKVQLREGIGETKASIFVNKPVRFQNIATSPEMPKFNDVFTGLVKEVNTTMKAPDQLMDDAIVGNGADIHDVMLAMSKAELSLDISTKITTKVIQAYEKVIAIQV